MKNSTSETLPFPREERIAAGQPDGLPQYDPAFCSQPGEPLVSIVINNYNYGSFVGCAIDSALQQTYKSIEVIVVDDGSTDESRAVIELYGGRIKTIFQKNGGQAAAYNAGFAASCGQLLLYLDADDVLDDNAIEECVRLWQPGVAGIRFYLRVVLGIDETPTDIVLPTSRLAEGDLREETLRYGYHISPPSSGNLYARAALAQILPMPESDWRIGADTFCIFLTALLGDVKASRKSLGRYRVHGNNHDIGHCENLRERLKKDLIRDRMFETFCEKKGLSYVPGSVTGQISHLKLRLSSLLTDPAHHLYPADRPLALAWRTMWVACRSQALALPKKLLVAGWVLAMLLTSRRKRSRLVELALLPTRRFSLVNRALSPVKASRRNWFTSTEQDLKV